MSEERVKAMQMADSLDQLAEMPFEGSCVDPLIEVVQSLGHQAAVVIRAVAAAVPNRTEGCRWCGALEQFPPRNSPLADVDPDIATGCADDNSALGKAIGAYLESLPLATQGAEMSNRRHDLGMIVSRLSREITSEQLAEMLALAYSTTATQMGSPHIASYNQNEIAAPLFKAKLLQRGLVDKLGDARSTRGFGYISLTTLGWLVLLSRCEHDLQRLGAIPPEPEREDYE